MELIKQLKVWAAEKSTLLAAFVMKNVDNIDYLNWVSFRSSLN